MTSVACESLLKISPAGSLLALLGALSLQVPPDLIGDFYSTPGKHMRGR